MGGLTKRMFDALRAIIHHVAAEGAMPSRRQLAAMLECQPNNANRLMHCLVERGEVHAASPGGALAGFGGAGVSVRLPPAVAKRLAAFCLANDEDVAAVVADAVTLLIDALEVAGDE